MRGTLALLLLLAAFECGEAARSAGPGASAGQPCTAAARRLAAAAAAARVLAAWQHLLRALTSHSRGRLQAAPSQRHPRPIPARPPPCRCGSSATTAPHSLTAA